MPRSTVTLPVLVVASLLLPILPLLAAVANAQTGMITGAVRDVEGEPIVGAEVVGENTEWQRRVEATTNDAGRFFVHRPPAGTLALPHPAAGATNPSRGSPTCGERERVA